jgi:hypothetical protein
MNRIKLHVITSQQTAALLRAARLLSAAGIPLEAGSNFIKFPRGHEQADALAASLKAMGFKPLPTIDEFTAETNDNCSQRVASLLAAEQAAKPKHDCGHDHAPGEACNHDHHGHEHGHDHGHQHEHDHSHAHSHSHDHQHAHEHDHKGCCDHDHDHKH